MVQDPLEVVLRQLLADLFFNICDSVGWKVWNYTLVNAYRLLDRKVLSI